MVIHNYYQLSAPDLAPSQPSLQGQPVADDVTTFLVRCSFRSRPGSVITWSYNGTTVLPPCVITNNPTSTPDGTKYTIVTQDIIWDRDSTCTVADRRATTGRYQCHGTVSLGPGQDSKTSDSPILDLFVQCELMNIIGSIC